MRSQKLEAADGGADLQVRPRQADLKVGLSIADPGQADLRVGLSIADPRQADLKVGLSIAPVRSVRN